MTFGYEQLQAAIKSDAPSALCIVTHCKGSTPRKPGAKMIVTLHSQEVALVGTVGGGAFEMRVIELARSVIASRVPQAFEISLTHELAMCCGGTMTVYIEPLEHRPLCLIFGAGHIGKALATTASHAGFDIALADPRPELLTAERLPCAKHLFSGYESSDLEKMPLSDNTYVVIATHDHDADQNLVEALIVRPTRYLALVGSKRKAQMTHKRCLNKGFSPELLAQLRCPAGVDIFAETPEEIAVSIVAQMIAEKNRPCASPA